MNIITKLPENVSDLEIVICCGKGLGPKGEVDWVLSSRLDLAVETAIRNPNSILLLSGGIGFTADSNQKQITEAEAMYEYLLKNYPKLTNKVIKESKSRGSLEQLCLIKENYIVKNNFTKIAIVSDEFHMNRVSTLLDAVLGDGYSVFYLGSKINLYGKYRQLIEDFENINYSGALELVKLLPRGDHNRFMNFDKAYKELRSLKLKKGESRLDYISPKEVIDFMGNSGKY